MFQKQSFVLLTSMFFCSVLTECWFCLGSTLLNHVLELCAKQNIGEIYLHVQTNNKDAISFYKKFGFEITETIQNYYTNITPPDCYVVTKIIAQTKKWHLSDLVWTWLEFSCFEKFLICEDSTCEGCGVAYATSKTCTIFPVHFYFLNEWSNGTRLSYWFVGVA